MYNLIKSKSISYLAKEVPFLFTATLVAEFFYKFGSFTLELIAFFFTWYLLSRIASFLTSKRSKII